MYIEREVNLTEILLKKSLFLFGPRQSGKTTYINKQLTIEPKIKYNLLDFETFTRLSNDPSYIKKVIEANDYRNCLVVIDEIQELPIILNTVQLLIDERDIKFLLTGSSARKLKRASSNLLGGRARWRNFYPLSYYELSKTFEKIDLDYVLNIGLIPSVYLSSNPEEDLNAYANLYLKEEIKAEGISRKITDFSRFLQIAAINNSQEINYTKIANDAQLKNQTITRWFEVLEDTLIGFFLEPYTELKTRKSIQRKKFYFFDTGIARNLRDLEKVIEGTSIYGEFFEQFIILEIKKFINFKEPSMKMNYIRTSTGIEIDCLLNKQIAIEIKSSKIITNRHYKNLKMIKENFITRKIVVCQTLEYYKEENIEIMPYKVFIEKLWKDEIT
ncbi:MAG: ATP-binding protein [Spirochaetaceae bacterium]|nr:ATP-binding protein [Spirochaetaceae bacterium]